MRALLTGCAGFIGSHLTEALLEEGCEVVGIDCFNDNYGRPEKLRNLERARSWDNFDFVPIDLARGQLEEYVSDCDTVFHLAAEPGVRASWHGRFDTYLRNNVVATQHLLDAALSEPGRRIVHASSSSIYGQAERFPTSEDALPEPQSPYGVTKLAAEHLCSAYHENFGVDVVSLRYFSVYGPRQRPDMAFAIFIAAALSGTPITVFGDGKQTRDFTFVGDVIAATRAAASAPEVGGGTYNVGGGSQVGLSEALAIIEQLAGRTLDVTRQDREPGDVRDTSADTRRAEVELGFVPSVGVRQGLEQQFAWRADALGARRSAGAPS
jgi:UDP-glucose 4-epimerase